MSPEASQSMKIVCVHGDQAVEIQNGANRLVKVSSGLAIAPNSTARVALPALFQAQDALFEIRRGHDLRDDDPHLRSIDPPRTSTQNTLVPAHVLDHAPSSNTLASWFTALSRLQRCSGSSLEFLQQAAAAVCDPGGLDAGMIVMQRGDYLTIEASHICHPTLGITYCHNLVQRAIQKGKTFYCDAVHDHTHADSFCEAPDPIVAAPILVTGGEIIGAVYGSRTLRGKNQRFRIRSLEALWVQLVADTVGATLQRAEAEARATRTRVLFEQAFCPATVDEIMHNPQALEGQEREVTVLFCDIQDSTRITEQLGPERTYRLLGEVLEFFTDHVLDHDGVIIDYYGDGLAAMWNAPQLQDDHADRACKAALAIQAKLDKFQDSWRGEIEKPFCVGIGIHTGIALVGNAGTTTRLKYGPRGQMVHLASRLERATRDFDTPILISAGTQARVTCSFSTKQLGQSKLPGIENPVELFALRGSDENPPHRVSADNSLGAAPA